VLVCPKLGKRVNSIQSDLRHACHSSSVVQSNLRETLEVLEQHLVIGGGPLVAQLHQTADPNIASDMTVSFADVAFFTRQQFSWNPLVRCICFREVSPAVLIIVALIPTTKMPFH
jgi:hypothetical protein